MKNSREKYIERCQHENETTRQNLKPWIRMVREDGGENMKGKPIGAVVCFWKDDELWLGASFCHKNDRHKFNKHVATSMAFNRTLKVHRIKPFQRGHLAPFGMPENVPPGCKKIAVYMIRKALEKRAHTS